MHDFGARLELGLTKSKKAGRRESMPYFEMVENYKNTQQHRNKRKRGELILFCLCLSGNN